MKRVCTTILFCALLLQQSVMANRIPGLERKISIQVKQKPIEFVLTEIARQAEITFSYNPATIGASQIVDIEVKNQTVRYALNQLFNGEVAYRERGKFLILQPARQTKKNAPAIIEGYLYDQDGETLADATVYSSDASSAVNTNEYGYFRIEIDANDTTQQVRASKLGYDDALLIPITDRTSFVELELPAVSSQLVKANADTSTRQYPAFMISRDLQLAATNITQSFQRVVQFSLFPHVGTNLLLSGTTNNLFSFNLVGGYVQSVKVLEMGGFMNLVRYDAGVFQAAGFANYVGRNVHGFQSAGFANHVGGNMFGLQGAGFMNNVRGSATGVQSAGFANHAMGDVMGVQNAGFLNRSGRTLIGLQASGGFNIGNWVRGAQLAGGTNVAANVSGVQAAGVANVAQKIEGVQLSGILNIADTVVGLQASGVINFAKHVKGFQLGLINVSDTCAGASLGLINFVSKGYRRIDVYASETFQANMAIRSGVRKLHNIYMAGFHLQTISNMPLYTFGLGLGTNFGNSPKLRYDLDFTMQQIVLGSNFAQINMLHRVGFGCELKIAPKTALFASLTYNLYLADLTSPYYESAFSNIAPYYLTNQNLGASVNLKTWFGFKAGLRFF